MKKYFNKLVAPVFGLLFFAACQKTETNITYAGNMPGPVLTSNLAANDTIALAPADTLKTALALSWTNPNYSFSNGISSLNVNYNLQIDTAGDNFANYPKNVLEVVAADLSTTITEGQLNSFLGNTLLLQTGVAHTIQVRVESFLNQNSLPLYSNPFTYVVTPYAPPPKVSLPTTGTLFIVGGDPLLGGWNNSVPANQQFTEVSPTEYYIIITLSGGDPTQSSDQFSVTSEDGTWNGQYGVPSANLTSAYSGGGSFNANGVNGSGTNFPGPVAAGSYKIDLNFQTGAYTETLQ